MEMTGENRVPAPREVVWQALNDPEILKQSIPGCEEIEQTSPTEFTAKVTAKVGPVKARFGGKVTLSDLDPPSSYKISGEGQGGAAGFAKGGAEVRLEPDGDHTILRYTVQAAVGGKLAQIGSRLIEGTARKMADDFFARFAEAVVARAAVSGAAAAASAAMETPPTAAEPVPSPIPPVAPGSVAASPSPTPRPVKPAASGEPGGVKPLVWVAGLIIIVIALLLIFGLPA